MEVLGEGELRELAAERKVLRLEKPFQYDENGVNFLLLPYDGFLITFHINYDHHLVGSQSITIEINRESFLKELAPARTFCFQEEVEKLRGAGLIKGGSLDNAIVIGKKGILNKDSLRFKDELVRHKILDLIGDLSLLGLRIEAHVIASRSGHSSNINLARKLAGDFLTGDGGKPQVLQLDISQILEIERDHQ
jgi:UDP-3-O-acyl-N-acetylglucosamine deacetylase